MIILAIIIALIIGFLLGRGSIKLTYLGEIVEQEPEDGRIRYSLEIDTKIPLEDLPKKKRVILKVVPYQSALFYE